MKTLIQIKALLGILALAALIPATAPAQTRGGDTGSSSLTSIDRDELLSQVNANTDSLLARINVLDRQEVASMTSVRETNGTTQVLVEISLASGESLADSARNLLAGSDLDLEVLQGSDPDRLRAWVDAGQLALIRETLDQVSADAEIRAYRSPVANAGSIESEGTSAMLADIYHQAGARGEGVKIALFDIGYQGLSLMADETGLDADLAGITNPEDDASAHGTAMLEVLHDTAPDAQLLPYRLDENLDVYTATADAIASGADIIVCPLSWFELPGEGAACDAALLAVDNGVMWVNAAGNFSNGAYLEMDAPLWTSYNRSTYISFMESGLDPQQEISGLVDGESFSVHMSYEVPTGSALQLSLELHAWDGVSMSIVDAATAGLQSQTVSAIADGRTYYAMVRLDLADVMGRIRMFLPNSSHSFRYSSTEGAIANPATLSEVISVSATPALAYGVDGRVEAQSSRGGGLWNLEVDMCGPSGISTSSYGENGFHGTSAASASIGGLLALQLGDSGLAQDPLGNLLYVGNGNAEEMGAGAVFAMVDAAEPDNAQDQASDLGSSSVLVAGRMISPSSDVDFYSIELASPKSIRVTVDGELLIDLIAKEGALDEDITGTGSAYRALASAGTHFIRVSSGNGNIVPGYVMNVEIFDGPPSQVELLTPADGATVNEGAEVSWSPSQSSLPVIYIVEFAQDKDFTMKVTTQSTNGEASKLPADYQEEQVFWRVMAMNSNGDSSDYSEVGYFKVVPQGSGELTPVVGTGPVEGSSSLIGGAAGADNEVQSISGDDSAGCTSGSNSGLIFLMLAILGSVAGIRMHHKRTAQEVKA